MFLFNFFKKNKNNQEKRIPPIFPPNSNIEDKPTNSFASNKKDEQEILKEVKETNVSSLENEAENEDSSVIDDKDEKDVDKDEEDDNESDGGKVKFGLG